MASDTISSWTYLVRDMPSITDPEIRTDISQIMDEYLASKNITAPRTNDFREAYNHFLSVDMEDSFVLPSPVDLIYRWKEIMDDPSETTANGAKLLDLGGDVEAYRQQYNMATRLPFYDVSLKDVRENAAAAEAAFAISIKAILEAESARKWPETKETQPENKSQKE